MHIKINHITLLVDIMTEQSNFQTSHEFTPRFAYVCEPKNTNFATARRVISIAFTYNNEGEVIYGSSIFVRTNKQDPENKTFTKTTFEKKNFHTIAMGRFKSRPVTFKMQTEHGKLPEFKKVVNAVRKTMHTRGVHGEERTRSLSQSQTSVAVTTFV